MARKKRQKKNKIDNLTIGIALLLMLLAFSCISSGKTSGAIGSGSLSNLLSGTTSDIDSDGDGWSDYAEIRAGSDPDDPESTPEDSDGDGYSNVEEEAEGTDPDDRHDYPADFDDDGYTHDEEVAAETDPRDETSYPDDFDDDGYTHDEEIDHGSDPRDDTSYPEDFDGDGYTHDEEIRYDDDPEETSRPEGTDPRDDTDYPDDFDHDGWTHDEEIGAGTDPRDPEDHPEELEPFSCDIFCMMTGHVSGYESIVPGTCPAKTDIYIFEEISGTHCCCRAEPVEEPEEVPPEDYTEYGCFLMAKGNGFTYSETSCCTDLWDCYDTADAYCKGINGESFEDAFFYENNCCVWECEGVA